MEIDTLHQLAFGELLMRKLFWKSFFRGNKEINLYLLDCHFNVYRAYVWCISFFGRKRDVIDLRLLEHC